MDKIFIERLRCSLTCEVTQLREIADGLTALRLPRDWVAIYSTERPHAALGG